MFQRFFITATQYDKTLHEKMPEIIDDLINQLTELRPRTTPGKNSRNLPKKRFWGC